MINTPDIQQKIKTDFGAQAGEVFKLLDAAITNHSHLNDARLIRCIVFLSDKKVEGIKASINSAITDPRDVLLWAEYIQSGPGDQTTRVRDFNKTFEDSEKDVSDLGT